MEKNKKNNIEVSCSDHTKNILLAAKHKIESVPNWRNHIEKMKLIEGYANLLGYYKTITGKNDGELNDFTIDEDAILKYDKRVIKKTSQKLIELSELAPYLYERFDKLINIYKENGFVSYKLMTNFNVSSRIMYDYLEEFLNTLGLDVCELYNKMILNNSIFLHNDLEILGCSRNSMPIDNPRIIVTNDEKSYDFYTTLVHETGHCYQYYLQRNHIHFESFNIFMETTSVFFERLFIEFLKCTKEYNRQSLNAEIDEHIYFLNNISAAKGLCKLFMTNAIEEINPFTLEYTSRIEKNKLLDEMAIDCGYVLENKEKVGLTEFNYSIGNINTMFFLNKAKVNFDETLKEYKNFICMVDNYPLKEILDKYFDMDIMENNIKKFIKSYHNR